jgi:topoisomerase IA-like protein
MPLSKFIIPRSIPLPPYEMVSNPIKPTYIKIWSRGDNLRTSKNRLEQLEKVYGNDFDFTVKGRMKGGKRTIKKRTNKKRTNKKRTTKKRTNKKQTNKKRTNKKKTKKQ